MTLFLQIVVLGAATGMIYALVAIGFVLIYKSTGLFNLAHGEFLMMGAYLCLLVITGLNCSIWLGALLALVMAVILGLVCERLALRPMIGQPLLAGVMMTIALSLILKAIVMMVWEGDFFWFPQSAGSLAIPIEEAFLLSGESISVLLIAVLFIVGFSLFFKFARTGLSMRASAEDQQVAQSVGVAVKQIFRITWAIAALVAAVGGILLGSMNGIDMGLAAMGLKVLPIVLLGGLDSIGGAIVAGVFVGVIENVASVYGDPLLPSGGGLGTIVPFGVMLVVMLFRPYGLFGLKKIERI